MTHQTLTAGVGETNEDHTTFINTRINHPSTNATTTKRPTLINFQSKTMISTILSLLLLTTVHAQEELCSCSPREYYFKLDLSATCPPLPPPYPPNDVFGAGVKDYTCTIGPEPVPSGNSREDYRNLLDSTMGFNDNPKVDDFVIPLIVDPEPVVIDSIQFFEVDPEFNVINQDPSYVRDVYFQDGDVFNYTSISSLITTSGKENYSIPGGINMVLRGYNAAGERVRNVFTITFTNECGEPTFEAGDEIGWVIFDSFVPASEETCRSIDPSSDIPTPSPDFSTTIFPTPSPESSYYGPPKKPTRRPSKKPTRRPTSHQSKPPQMSMDFTLMYSKFKPVPKAHKVQVMSSPNGFSYQFQLNGKSNKGGKSVSWRVGVGKSGKSRSKGSKGGDEPIRNLRATLDQVDLDSGKPMKRLR